MTAAQRGPGCETSPCLHGDLCFATVYHSLTSNFSSSKRSCGCCLNFQNILRMNRSQGKYFRATLMLLI